MSPEEEAFFGSRPANISSRVVFPDPDVRRKRRFQCSSIDDLLCIREVGAVR
jgi:hypothetical protein